MPNFSTDVARVWLENLYTRVSSHGETFYCLDGLSLYTCHIRQKPVKNRTFDVRLRNHITKQNIAEVDSDRSHGVSRTLHSIQTSCP